MRVSDDPLTTWYRRHSLVERGAPHDDDGNRVNLLGSGGPGRAMCRCGALSPVLSSQEKRRQWHWDHRSAVRNEHIAANTRRFGSP